MEGRGDLVAADALDLVRLPVALFLVCLGVIGVDRAHWIPGDDADFGVPFLQVAAGAADRTACSRRADEVRHLPARLFPDFRPCGLIMDFRVYGIVVLIREDGVLVGRRDRTAFHDVIVRVIGWNGSGRDDHFGAEGAQQSRFFLRHLVRHRENAAIPLHCRDKGEAHSGVAGRCLDNQAPRFEASLALGRFDHCETDAILNGPAGIEKLRLGIHGCANPARDLVKSNQWGPANRLEDVVVRLSVLRHSSPFATWSCRAATWSCRGPAAAAAVVGAEAEALVAQAAVLYRRVWCRVLAAAVAVPAAALSAGRLVAAPRGGARPVAAEAVGGAAASRCPCAWSLSAGIRPAAERRSRLQCRFACPEQSEAAPIPQ